MKTLFKTLGMLGLFFFLLGNVGWGQTTYNWNNASGGDWQVATNWTPARNSVASTDVLQFTTATNLTVTNLPATETIGKLIIDNGTLLSIRSGTIAGSTLTLSNTTAEEYALTILGSSGLTLLGFEEHSLDEEGNETVTVVSGKIILALASNTRTQVYGSIICTADANEVYDVTKKYGHQIQVGTGATMSFGNSSTFSYGPYTATDPVTAPFTGSTASVTFEDGSTYNAISGLFGSNPNHVLGNMIVTFNAGSKYVHLNDETGPLLSGRTYGYFEYNSKINRTVTFLSSFNIKNSFIVRQGYLTLQFLATATANRTNSIKGNIEIISGAKLIFENNNVNYDATYILDGSALQNIIVGGWFELNGKLNDAVRKSILKIPTGSTVDIGAGVIQTQYGIGEFQCNDGATLKIGNIDGIASSGNNGNIQTTIRTFGTAANYEYNGIMAQVTGNALPSTVNNLIFNNSGIVANGIGVTLTNSVAVTVTANVQSGMLIFNGKTITGANFNLTDGAKIKIDNPDGITALGSALGNVQTTTSRTFGTGADYEYIGSSEQYTGDGLPSTVRNLTFNNTFNTKLTNPYTVTGTAEVKTGAVLGCNTKYIDGGTGTFNLNSGGTIRICNSNGITASSAAGNIQTAIRSFSPLGNYVYTSATGPQVTGDGLPSTVNSLTIDNSSNGVTLTNNVSTSTCVLTSGNIKLGDKNLKILSGGSLTGSFDGTHMIVTNGTGELQKELTSNSTLTYPVGDNSGNYTPASLNFTSGTYGSNAYAGVKVTNSRLPENNSTVVYLNRYWEVNQSNISNFSCGVNFQYLIADIAGSAPNEADLWGGRYSSSAWYILLKVNGSTHQITGTTTGFSKFTGGQESAMPVSLQSFTSNVSGRNVGLQWVTSSETNNSGFNIERKTLDGSWSKVGYIAGNGTRNTPTTYNFNDIRLNTGKYQYRLKQIDNNGNFEYHNLDGTIEVGVPKNYDLSQNYPNPFNPTTKIDFSLPFNSKVILVVYDMSGREVKTLVNEARTAGYHTVEMNASMLSSGTYFFRIIANANGKDFISTKKMVLVK